MEPTAFMRVEQSEVPSGKGLFIKLDFLNDYKLDILKENGVFIDDNSWTIKYDIIKNEIYTNTVFKIIEKNFLINSEYMEDSTKDVEISRENIKNLLSENQNRLELNFNDEKTYGIYNGKILLGFIEMHITDNIVGKPELNIVSMEIFEENRGFEYGSELIDLLKEMFNIDIYGYSKPDDKSINFWTKNGAGFDSCTNCEQYDNCQGKEFDCDNPLEFCFYITV